MSAQSSPLRVAMIASSLRLGGAEKQTAYMSRALLQAGVDVRLIYLGSGGYYEPVLREVGVPVHQIYVANRPLTMLIRLTNHLRQWRPHIVLVNQFGDLRYGGFAGRFCGALTLGGVRSDGWYELNAHGWLSRFLFRMADGLIANSSRARKTLAVQGINPHKIKVLPNVIDLQDFDARSALPFSRSLPPGRIIAAAVGNLHPSKRFDRFLEALARARRSQPALAGVIAGADRGDGRALRKKARSLGLGPDDIVFLGECSEVPALLARSAMLVLSSDYEGFPNVLIEAMAARLPVVTTPAGDAGLIVEHEQTGYVVSKDDSRRMADYMVRLAEFSTPRSKLGEAGRQRVERDYSHESLAGRLTAIFRKFAVQKKRNSLLELLGRTGKNGSVLSEQLLLEGPAA